MADVSHGMAAVNRRVIDGFRSGAPMGGMPRERMLLLTVTGRRTGIPHTIPMMFVHVDGVLAVVASNSGAATDPQWLRNLVADPHVHVETATEEFDAVARVVDAAARPDAWAQVVAQIPMYAKHQAGTQRPIPVVLLERPEA